MKVLRWVVTKWIQIAFILALGPGFVALAWLGLVLWLARALELRSKRRMP